MEARTQNTTAEPKLEPLAFATQEELRAEAKLLQRNIEILEIKIARINSEMRRRVWWLIVAMYLLALSTVLLAVAVIRG